MKECNALLGKRRSIFYLSIYLFLFLKNCLHLVTLQGLTPSLIPTALCGLTFYVSLLAKQQGGKGCDSRMLLKCKAINTRGGKNSFGCHCKGSIVRRGSQRVAGGTGKIKWKLTTNHWNLTARDVNTAHSREFTTTHWNSVLMVACKII